MIRLRHGSGASSCYAEGRKARALDFIANKTKAKETTQEYLDFVTNDNENELTAPQAEWVRDFWRVYNAGIALQENGKIPKVSIS